MNEWVNEEINVGALPLLVMGKTEAFGGKVG